MTLECMRLNPFVTPDQICVRWIEGKTCEEIAAIYCVSPTVVSYILQINGVEIKPGAPKGKRGRRLISTYRNPSQETIERAALVGALMDDGNTQQQIARYMNISQATVSKLKTVYLAFQESEEPDD